MTIRRFRLSASALLAAITLVACVGIVAAAGNRPARADSAWSGWSPLQSVSAGGPDAASRAPGSVDLFWRGTDDQLWHRVLRGGVWQSPEPLGGVLAADPSAVAMNSGRLDVVVQGPAGRIYTKTWTAGGGWAPWVPVTGSITGSPSVNSLTDGRLDLVVRWGQQIFYRSFTVGSGWSGWTDLGGAVDADPAIVSEGTDRLDVFARGLNHGLYVRSLIRGAWTSWGLVGGQLASGPDAASWADGRVDVFVVGPGAHLYQKTWTPAGWSPWSDLGGSVSADPGVVSWGAGRIDVFARASNTGLYTGHIGSTVATPTGVLGVGDSIMLGAAPYLEAHGWTVDAVVGRQWDTGVADIAERRAIGQLPPVVVVGLGTNGPVTSAQFDAMMAQLSGQRLVVFVNNKMPLPWQDANDAVLAAGVARYGNTRLVDWRGASASHPEWFISDGIHLSPAGQQAYASLVLAAA